MLYKSLLFFIFLLPFSTPPNDEAIAWKDGNKLTWNQFKGKPKANISAVAVTASGITFEFSVKETDKRIVSFETKVFAHFYPHKSWYIKEQGTAHILNHEQLHFDLTELYARKFRMEISKLRVSNSIKDQLRNLHQQINRELAEAQNRYDTETDNSIVTEQQDKWNVYVQKELAKLDAYKSQD